MCNVTLWCNNCQRPQIANVTTESLNEKMNHVSYHCSVCNGYMMGSTQEKDAGLDPLLTLDY